MDVELYDATKADIDRIVAIQFSAFEGDPYQEALYPGPYFSPTTRAAASDRIRKSWGKDPREIWTKCVDRGSGNIVAFAQWNLYEHERPAEEWQKLPIVDWCEGRLKEVAENFTHMSARLQQKALQGRPFLYLGLLCVHQDFQRQGAGTALVNWGVELAQAKGLPLFICSSPAGYQLYEKMGFQREGVEYVRAGEWEGDTDIKCVGMIKSPTSE